MFHAAALDDGAILHDQNLIGFEDGGEAVRDDDGSSAGESGIEGTLDGGFRFGIEMSGGLVEDDDVGGF